MIKIKEKLEKIKLDLIKSNQYALFNTGEITYNMFEFGAIGSKSCNFRVIEERIDNTNPLIVGISLLCVHDTLAEDDLVTHVINFFKTQEHARIEGFYLNKYIILLEEFGEQDTELIEPYTIACFDLLLTII